MNRGQYLEYIDRFNNRRYDMVADYFAPDISVEFFTNWTGPDAPDRTLHGPHQYIALYKDLHEHVTEVMTLGDFLSEGNLIAAELFTEVHCFKDYPTFSPMPLKAGETVIMTNWVIYDLDDDGKMKRIRITHFRMHNPADPRRAKF